MRSIGMADSDLFHADPDLATRLWSEGFRPMEMQQLVKGNVVAFSYTMFGFNTGSTGRATVLEVLPRPNEWTVAIKHTSGTTEEDEGCEVWAIPLDE